MVSRKLQLTQVRIQAGRPPPPPREREREYVHQKGAAADSMV